MLGRILKFAAFWLIGATVVGLLLGRMIKSPGETPALVRQRVKRDQDSVEEKVS